MELLTLHYKNRILKHQHLRQVKKYASFFLFYHWEYEQYFFYIVRNQTSNKKYL